MKMEPYWVKITEPDKKFAHDDLKIANYESQGD